MTNINTWTRLARFVNREGQIRLGQPVDPKLDVGLAVAGGQEVEVHVIDGDVYSGTVTNEVDVIKQLLAPVSRQECSIIRCLGLNYKSEFPHAEVA